MVKSQNNPKTVRRSGVELYKIIAMILICTSHCVQTLESFVDFQATTTDWQMLLLRILRFSGNMGNIIFVICSSYFLLESQKSKKEKAINLLLDSQIISIGIFLSFLATATVLKSEFHFSLGGTLKQLFPDLFGLVWFVPCYAIFYLGHPAYNLVIKSISQKQHLGILGFIFIFYGLGGLIKIQPVYSGLLGFIFIYFTVAYLKLYCKSFIADKKKNLLLFFVFLFIFIVTVLIKNYLSFHISYFKTYPDISGLCSIIFLPMLICLFNVFLSMEFRSKFINYISSCSLFFYCIHENDLVRTSIRPKFYSVLIEKFGEQYILIYVASLIVALLVFGFAASAIYKQTFNKLTQSLSIKIKNFVDRKLDWILGNR